MFKPLCQFIVGFSERFNVLVLRRQLSLVATFEFIQFVLPLFLHPLNLLYFSQNSFLTFEVLSAAADCWWLIVLQILDLLFELTNCELVELDTHLQLTYQPTLCLILVTERTEFIIHLQHRLFSCSSHFAPFLLQLDDTLSQGFCIGGVFARFHTQHYPTLVFKGFVQLPLQLLYFLFTSDQKGLQLTLVKFLPLQLHQYLLFHPLLFLFALLLQPIGTSLRLVYL